MSTETSKPGFRVRLEDDEFIDELHFRTVPRFKTSGLSGDEWRHSIEVTAYRKGRVIGERAFNRLSDALTHVPAWLYNDLTSPIADPKMTHDLCDQPGCAEPWTVMYRIVRRGCGRCGARDRYAGDDYVRAFCERHAHRGDSDLDDMDDNYQPLDGAMPAQEHVPNPDDESPSVFGGIVKMEDLA